MIIIVGNRGIESILSFRSLTRIVHVPQVVRVGQR